MDCRQAVSAPVKGRPHPVSGSYRDIRAPRRFHLRDVLSWKHLRAVVLMLGDCFTLAIAWQIARFFNQFYSPIPPQLIWWTWLGLPSPFWIFLTLTLIVFAHNNLYGSPGQITNYVRSGKLVSAVYLASLAVIYIYDPKLDLPRSLFFTAWFSSVLLVILGRLLVIRLLKPLDNIHAQTRIFLIAPVHRLHQLMELMAKRSNYPLVGSARAIDAASPETFQAILASGAQQVIVDGLPAMDLASTLYWQLSRAGITMQLLPTSREMLYRRGQPEVLAGLPTLRLEAPLLGGWEYHMKRCLDFLGAALGLIVLSPLFVVIAMAIRLNSSGPVFFRQERIGLHGRTFQIWKFRTMFANAAQQQQAMEGCNESPDGVLFKIKRDPRVTRVGRFLRRTSLDELPQLLNVLQGQMSLVGPRPLPLRDVSRFEAWHHMRHQVLPGITGLWQISGRSNIDSFDDAARLDLHYIDNWSLNLDLEILMETLRIIFLKQGAY